MALNSYMTVEGPRGPIEGSAVATEHRGKIEVWSVHHEIVANLSTGPQAVSPPEHRPLRITKPLDPASPQLIDVAVTGDTLPRVLLEMYELDETGMVRLAYTIELKDARIVGVRTEMLDNRYNDNDNQPLKEIVSFSYAEIRWTHVPSSTTADDDLVGA